MRRSKGTRSKTRRLLKKTARQRLKITDILKTFEKGEKAILLINPSVKTNVPHPRFHGKTVTIVEQRGRGYVVEFKDGRKTKRVAVRPEHLRKIEA